MARRSPWVRVRARVRVRVRFRVRVRVRVGVRVGVGLGVGLGGPGSWVGVGSRPIESREVRTVSL